MSADNILTWSAFAFSLLGAAIAIFCYMPGALKTLKTNDTRGISEWMFGLTCFGCLIWVIYSILMLSSSGASGGVNSKNWSGFVGGFATLISNLGLGSFGGVILYKKIKNLMASKKEGLTEDQWYKKHYENQKN